MAQLMRILEKENRNKSQEDFVKVLYMEEEYVKGLIHNTMPNLNIPRIEKVNNNFLEGMYMLTKAEYESRYGTCEEKLLLHVTAQTNVRSITKDNLDWRRVTRGQYGKGNYFSQDAQLANQICNPLCGKKRAIIVCKVLVSRTSCGPATQAMPTVDTVISYEGKVFIKFGDNEFLPLFVAYYDYTT